MKLTEYLNQGTPLRMPKVILEPSEFIRHNSYNIGSETFTNIEIPAIWERYRTSGNYVQTNDEPCLKTQDADGNPLVYSCFYIAAGK